MNPPPITSTRPGPPASRARNRAASSRLRMVKTPSRARFLAFGHGRARVPVAISRRSKATSPAVGEVDVAAGRSSPVGRDAEQPLGVEVDEPRQGGVLHRQPSAEDRLRQGRPVVRLVRLVPDQGQWTGEALRAERLRGAQAGQRGADNTIRPVQPHRCRHAISSPPSLIVRQADADGLDRAGRGRTYDLLAQRVVGVVVEFQRLLAVKRKTVGAAKTHCP